ncbi:hypothetical protein [Dactylosporangium salmoneum]|uniref:Uncharacterized protein n=1 Tax=Dactylosporangium salmoneum TaxID=53361 RepID=A0ABN3FDL9_9ACTN
MASEDEDDLYTQARTAILQRIIRNAENRAVSGDNGVLELAEAYTVLRLGVLSGRVNAK